MLFCGATGFSRTSKWIIRGRYSLNGQRTVAQLTCAGELAYIAGELDPFFNETDALINVLCKLFEGFSSFRLPPSRPELSEDPVQKRLLDGSLPLLVVTSNLDTMVAISLVNDNENSLEQSRALLAVLENCSVVRMPKINNIRLV